MEVKYKTIYQTLKDQIFSGTYPTNARIPDELSLCKEFDASRMTVKKALDLLVQEGIIYRRQGQGTFVLPYEEQDNLINIQESKLEGFTRSSRFRGAAKKYSFDLEFADETVARALDIPVGDPVYHIERIRYYHDKPYVWELTYMSPSQIPGVTDEVLNASIYQHIEKTLGLRIHSSKRILRAQPSTPKDQELLGLRPDEPVLEVEQIAYLDTGAPFEYSFSRHRYDRFKFSAFALRQ